jgi:hypothetical protein
VRSGVGRRARDRPAQHPEPARERDRPRQGETHGHAAAVHGVSHGGRVWFVLTESSDLNEAVRLAINWTPKLTSALGTPAVQHAELSGGALNRTSVVHFAGTVDFSGRRVVIPGPDLFPVAPGKHAGPVGDANYSPLFTFGNGIVYNGEQIANSTGVHPKVVSLDVGSREATIRMTEGRYLDRQVLYFSTDASDTVVAALENATYAPNLAAAPRMFALTWLLFS